MTDASKLENVSQLIEAMGGVGQLAKAGEWPLGTTSAWKTRGRIPTDYWPRLIELAQAQGLKKVDAALLLELHTPAKVEAAQ